MRLYLSAVLFLWKWKIFELLAQLKDYGTPGLFVITLLDSAFVPIPSGPDVLMVTLALQSSPLEIVKYVVVATIGSTLGCLLLYMLARQGGESVLKRVSAERRDYVQHMLGRYDSLAIIAACLMPPPFPFKPFILVSGVLDFKLSRLIIGLLIGRSLRYLLLGMLALYFGPATIDLLKKFGIKFFIVVASATAIYFIVRYFRNRKTEKAEEPVTES